ncbi:cytochrome P450 monooxygenase [Lasiosphaeria ovina]|uniref:Cytochrome P450 monooxygenase n=1 Tax=Lasiosphaeria ovina TaxID=92902 RepID=A0AAE0NB99_9PEZI|nr:cytochrome P450 monooxygenase [Lasiosphaeria ovina]
MAVFVDYRAIALVAGASTVVFLVGLLRRRFFHPLSKFPGPFINSVSWLPNVVRLLGGKHHVYIKKLHDKYGPVVRVSPNELSFSNPDAWEDIYGFRSSDEPMEKDPLWCGSLQHVEADVPITMAPRRVHTRQRRAFAHSFSNTSLLSQEPLIQSHVDKFMDQLAGFAAEDKPVNMSDWLSFYTLDVISELCLGSSTGLLATGSGTEWSRGIVLAARGALFDQATRRVAGPGTWFHSLLSAYAIPPRYKAAKLNHFLNTKKRVLPRLADADADADHKDFIYYILRNNESKKLLSETEIIVNMGAFLAAGSDTTALALSALVYLILTHRKVYDKLAAEIRGGMDGVSSAADITWARVKDLPYVGAVMNETMRLHSPVLASLLRAVPPRGATIDGHFVPAGTTVSVPHWTASHSARNWTRPYEFLPERWLEPEAFPDDKLQASQPFMLGPRGCIGKNLSLIEQRLVLCHLLWHFDLELDGGREAAWRWERDGDEFRHLQAYIIWEKVELMVKPTPVQR